MNRNLNFLRWPRTMTSLLEWLISPLKWTQGTTVPDSAPSHFPLLLRLYNQWESAHGTPAHKTTYHYGITKRTDCRPVRRPYHISLNATHDAHLSMKPSINTRTPHQLLPSRLPSSVPQTTVTIIAILKNPLSGNQRKNVSKERGGPEDDHGRWRHYSNDSCRPSSEPRELPSPMPHLPTFRYTPVSTASERMLTARRFIKQPITTVSPSVPIVGRFIVGMRFLSTPNADAHRLIRQPVTNRYRSYSHINTTPLRTLTSLPSSILPYLNTILLFHSDDTSSPSQNSSALIFRPSNLHHQTGLIFCTSL
jgi:hypothetical protein